MSLADGHDVMPITRMMLRTDGPRIAASTMASGRNGITRNHFGDAHENGADLAAVEPGRDPDDRADHDRDERCGKSHEEARARTPDELGQDVATQAVRAQRPELRRVREGGVVRRG